MKVAVIVFDWSWHLIGHVMSQREEKYFPTNPIEWDYFNSQAAKQITSERHIHIATAIVPDDEELTVTEDVIRAVKEQYQSPSVPFTETWEYTDSSFTAVKLP
jgi:glutaredoxin